MNKKQDYIYLTIFNVFLYHFIGNNAQDDDNEGDNESEDDDSQGENINR